MSDDDPQRDPVIFGNDPFTHDRPPVEDEDRPTYRPPAHWPVIVMVVAVVAVLVAAVGLFVF
jgi:hypothetical protein